MKCPGVEAKRTLSGNVGFARLVSCFQTGQIYSDCLTWTENTHGICDLGSQRLPRRTKVSEPENHRSGLSGTGVYGFQGRCKLSALHSLHLRLCTVC